VQDEIAQAIVDKLRIQLAPDQQKLAQRERAPTENVEAYQLYLQGRAIWKRRGEENLRQAIDLYQSALGRDPAFARANAALASAYVVLPGYTMEQGDEEKYYELARNAARKALAVDPNIGEAHAVLAQINANRGDLLDAESGFFFAISLEPNEATPHQWYSILLRNVGRLDAALTQAKRAQELDPASPIIAANLAQLYLVRGDDDQALRFSKLAAELGLVQKDLGIEADVARRRGQWDEAKQLYARQELIPSVIRAQIGPIVDALADPALRPKMAATLQAIDPKVWPLQERVMPFVLLGRTDLAYQVLFDGLDKDRSSWVRDWDMSHVWSPEGRPLRTDPRFARLAERVGMVDYWKQYGYPDGCHAGTDAPIVCS
jgi:Flp pilus assembly protein TadD